VNAAYLVVGILIGAALVVWVLWRLVVILF
jgi:hypothetical protein